jgi:hypothetical protein
MNAPITCEPAAPSLPKLAALIHTPSLSELTVQLRATVHESCCYELGYTFQSAHLHATRKGEMKAIPFRSILQRYFPDRFQKDNSGGCQRRRFHPSKCCAAIVLGTAISFPAPAANPPVSQAPPPPQSAPAAAAVPPPSAPAKRSAAELEKLAMPIALHPDPLISVILPAAVYPVEIVVAARFVKDTNNLSKVDAQPWDDSVKAVAKFPELIAKMDADLDWTVALGQVFLEQRKELMDTIQALRLKAQQAGTLKTTEQQLVIVTNAVVQTTVEERVVVVTNTIVQIVPSNPEVIYVPSYPPTVLLPAAGVCLRVSVLCVWATIRTRR